jgi:hypothetical protein
MTDGASAAGEQSRGSAIAKNGVSCLGVFVGVI